MRVNGGYTSTKDISEPRQPPRDNDARHPVTYRLVLPGRPLTVNAARRLHFHARAAHDRQWRQEGWVAARQAKVPNLSRVAITVQTELRHKRSQDHVAELPSYKAALDGLVDAGVLSDDSPAFIDRVTFLEPVLGAERDALIIEIKSVS